MDDLWLCLKLLEPGINIVCHIRKQWDSKENNIISLQDQLKQIRWEPLDYRDAPEKQIKWHLRNRSDQTLQAIFSTLFYAHLESMNNRTIIFVLGTSYFQFHIKKNVILKVLNLYSKNTFLINKGSEKNKYNNHRSQAYIFSPTKTTRLTMN